MRQPKPYFKKSHQAWYANIRGKTTRLDPDKTKAWEVYHRLMGDTSTGGPDLYVLDLINEFLDLYKTKKRPRTVEWYTHHLKAFHEFTGNIKAKDLRPFHVERWINHRYPAPQNGSTVNGAMRTIQRLCNWAEKSGRIDKSPLKGLEKPTPTTRDVYVTPEQFKALMEKVKDQQFKDFLNILRQTGCRPLEARLVEAKHYDRENRCWVFPVGDNANKVNKEERVVNLSKAAVEITERLVAKHPKGPIFRNRRGNPWDNAAIKCRCTRLTKAMGFRVIPYMLRYAFATDAIVRGVDLITIARLMGHKDLRMLQKVYNKLAKKGDHLRAALEKITNDEEAA